MEAVNIHLNHYKSTFNALREIYGKDANIQEGYLRLQQDLTSGQPSFDLSVVADSRVPSSRISEYLTTNDNFYVCGMSIAVFKKQTLLGTFDRSGNAPLFYYPDKTAFPYDPTPATNVAEYEALEAIWNGKYKIMSDTSELIYEAPLSRFRAAPVIQDTAATQPSSGQFHQDFIQQVYNPFIFEGKKQTNITVTFAPNADLTYIAGDPTVGTNHFVLFAYGWRIRNMSEALTIKEAQAIAQGRISNGKLYL